MLTLPPGDGTWPNGDGSVVATPDANGTITAPALTAGTGVLAGADVAHSLIVKVGPATGWTLQVMPGPPVGVTISSGDGQHAPAGKPFSQAMATKVTDAAGNPIPGAPVTFKVSSGEATFPPVNLRLAAAVTGKRALLHRADPPRNAVVVLTDDKGIATAPALTSGRQPGPIGVSASAAVAPTVKQAVFHLTADKVAPSAPTIDSLSNGNGQVSVAFTGASAGSAPITVYTVRASDQNHPTTSPVIATGPAIAGSMVKGTEPTRDPYVLTDVDRDQHRRDKPRQSSPSDQLNVEERRAGNRQRTSQRDRRQTRRVRDHRSPARRPPPATLASGEVPPGLDAGGLERRTGTPTEAGKSTQAANVRAINPVGIYDSERHGRDRVDHARGRASPAGHSAPALHDIRTSRPRQCPGMRHPANADRQLTAAHR